MRWVPAVRVDMLGLAFQFTALSVIAVKPFRLRNQIAAFCLLLLGLYTKQTFLAIPAASILLIGLIRPARAIWLACGFALAGLSILLTLAWLTDGGVIKHWIVYNINPFLLKNILFAEFNSIQRIWQRLLRQDLELSGLPSPAFIGTSGEIGAHWYPHGFQAAH